MSMVFHFRRYFRLPIAFGNLERKYSKQITKSSSKTSRFTNLFSKLSKGTLIVSPILLLLLSNEVYCATDESKGNSSNPGKPNPGDDPVEKLIKQAFPIVAPLGFGGVFGFASGFALRKLGEKVAYVVGLTFLGLQGLSYAGYIKIDYFKLADDAKKVIDTDLDGKITANDFILMWRKVKDMLTFHLPGAGGFSAGFALGLYLG